MNSEQQELLRCKGCSRRTHPYYVKKYHGYCLECSNCGVPERDDQIAALKEEVDLVLYFLNHLGYIEHSGSVSSSSFLTTAGRELRRWANDPEANVED